jgi:hypothetical protein
VLRIEENRMVRDIGGGEVMEIRWRPPAKAARDRAQLSQGAGQGAAIRHD